MNPEAQKYLDKILTKSPSDLTPPEIGFLRARQTYLKLAQVEEYKEVLEVKPVKEEPQVKEETSTEEVENQTSDTEPVKTKNAKSKE